MNEQEVVWTPERLKAFALKVVRLCNAHYLDESSPVSDELAGWFGVEALAQMLKEEVAKRKGAN